jgi:hypothetical protein
MKFCKVFYNFSNLAKEKTCDNCTLKKLESTLICGTCETIRNYKPSNFVQIKLNFFSIFNIKDQFNIDKLNLETKYKYLQKHVHPDKYALEDIDTLREAQECSSHLSNAYQTLKDDFKRANYLV